MSNYRDSEAHKSIMATIKKSRLLDKPKQKASAFEKTPIKTPIKKSTKPKPLDKIERAIRDAKRRRKKFMSFSPFNQ